MRGRNFWAVYERGASLLLVGIVTLLGVSLSPAVPGARAAPTVTVRLVVEEVRALDSIDSTSPADFYPKVSMNNGAAETRPRIDDDDHIAPDWTFTTPVDLATTKSIPITMELWDFDSFANGDDNLIDINSSVGPRALSLTVDLDPCSVTGNSGADANGLCGRRLTTAGIGDDRAQVWFRVEVDYPVVPDLRMHCTHGPVWPQPGQQVTFRVEALDGALNAQPVDRIELFINTKGAPTQTATGTSQLNATAGPFATGSAFYYGCRVTSGGNVVWSGWRRVQSGPLSPAVGRAVPISYTGSSEGRIDIVFIPDSNSYPAGAADLNFQSDVAAVIENAYYAQDVYLRNQDLLNFWIAQDTGTTAVVPNPGGWNDCVNTAPANWQTAYLFADAGALLHRPNCRDNAPTNQRFFSAEPTSVDVVVHEMGHTPFGLADEYCQSNPSLPCDGGYFPSTNIYSSQAACLADPLAAGVAGACQQIANASSSVGWWRLDSAATIGNDLMVNNGAYKAADTRQHDRLFAQCRAAKC